MVKNNMYTVRTLTPPTVIPPRKLKINPRLAHLLKDFSIRPQRRSLFEATHDCWLAHNFAFLNRFQSSVDFRD